MDSMIKLGANGRINFQHHPPETLEAMHAVYDFHVGQFPDSPEAEHWLLISSSSLNVAGVVASNTVLEEFSLDKNSVTLAKEFHDDFPVALNEMRVNMNPRDPTAFLPIYMRITHQRVIRNILGQYSEAWHDAPKSIRALYPSPSEDIV